MDPEDDVEVVSAYRTPFVLGKPIKNPADFYGRREVLRELFDAVLNGQLVSVVGEHRCGNTSVIYQMLHPDQRRRYLTPEQDRTLLFALITGQLAAEGPDAFFRRIGRSHGRDRPATWRRGRARRGRVDHDPDRSVRQLRTHRASLARLEQAVLHPPGADVGVRSAIPHEPGRMTSSSDPQRKETA